MSAKIQTLALQGTSVCWIPKKGRSCLAYSRATKWVEKNNIWTLRIPNTKLSYCVHWLSTENGLCSIVTEHISFFCSLERIGHKHSNILTKNCHNTINYKCVIFVQHNSSKSTSWQFLHCDIQSSYIILLCLKNTTQSQLHILP